MLATLIYGNAAWSNSELAAAHAKRNVTAQPGAGPPKGLNGGPNKLYVMNASRVVGGGEKSELLQVDLQASTVSPKTTGLANVWDYVSASTTCGDMYYAVATNAPIATGMLVLNLKTGEAKYPATESKLVHAIKCGNTAGTLTVVMSDFTSKRTFSLRSYDVASASTTLIANFPEVYWGGWDSVFSFNGDKVWAAFPKKPDAFGNIETGELIVMDSTTGQMISRDFPKKGGEPYYTVVPTGGDGTTFKAILRKSSSVSADIKLELCSCAVKGDKIDTSGCVDVSNWWDNGDPPAICPDGSMYIMPRNFRAGNTQPIYRADTSTGNLTHVIDLVGSSADYEVQTMACVAPAITSKQVEA